MTKTIECPNCAKKITWGPEETHRPFCSQRCRLIDLGAWADDNYRIPENEKTTLDGDSTDFEFTST